MGITSTDPNQKASIGDQNLLGIDAYGHHKCSQNQKASIWDQNMLDIDAYGHHKSRPKPKGKHCKSESVTVDNNDDSSQFSKRWPRSEFVTVTHGLKK